MEGGGAERAMANLLAHILPHLNSHRVSLLLLDNLPQRQNLPDNLEIITLDGRCALLPSLQAVHRHWRDPNNRPDICLSYLTRANVINAQLSRWNGHRALISERVNTSSHFATSRAAPLLKWMVRHSYKHAERVIAVSEGVSRDLSENFGVAPQKLCVIGNAIDDRKLCSLARQPTDWRPPEDFFVAMGRLVPNKNFSMMITAYAKLDGTPPLVILGEGPEKSALSDLAKDLGVGDRVFFPGFVENPYPIIAQARALLSSSLAEGFPNALAEAMALGCPVISTDCPSGPADILNGQAQSGPPWSASASGILVRIGDHEAMSLAISALCDSTTRNDFSKRAKIRSALFEPKSVIQSYLDQMFALERGN